MPQSNIDVSLWKATQHPSFGAPRPNKCCDSGCPGSNISLGLRKSPIFQWWHLLILLVESSFLWLNSTPFDSLCWLFGYILLRNPLKISNLLVHQSPNLIINPYKSSQIPQISWFIHTSFCIFPLFPPAHGSLRKTACRSSNFRSRASVEDSGLNCNLQGENRL